MNLLRWIFGIPLALAICIGEIYLSSLYNPIRMGGHFFLSQVHHLVIVATCFSSFVFLSCLFVPSNRKYAAIIAVLAGAGLIGAALVTIIIAKYSYGYFTLIVVLSYFSMGLGLLTGFFISYKVFKDKGWSRPQKPIVISQYFTDDSVKNEELN